MSEVVSVAYNIGQDSTFLLEPVAGVKYTGYEMADRLSSYLVGNGFMKLLAYYRLSKPDVIYTSSGSMTFHNFRDVYITDSKYTRTRNSGR